MINSTIRFLCSVGIEWVLTRVYIGTSGWVYDWNPDGIKWFVENSGLDTVELNMSFYRFPFPSMIKSWRRNAGSIRWSVKVHRSITHLRRLKLEALSTWRKFHQLFKPMDDVIDYYLFQLPPNYTCSKKENLKRIEEFYNATRLGERFALEFRNTTCFNQEITSWARENGLTLVSVDSPQATWITMSNKRIYLRLHGRTVWYGYEYTKEELEELARETLRLKPETIHVYFNNNHWMLENARQMKKIYEELLRK